MTSLSNTIKQTVETAGDMGFYPSLCQLQTNTVSRDDYGAEVPGWANAGSAIRCRLEPRGDVTTEIRRSDGTVSVDARYIRFREYHPEAHSAQRAEIDGITWDILGVDHDAQKTRTRLIVEEIG